LGAGQTGQTRSAVNVPVKNVNSAEPNRDRSLPHALRPRQAPPAIHSPAHVGLPLARRVFRDGLHPPARAIIRPRGGRPDAVVGVWAGRGRGMAPNPNDPPRIGHGCVYRHARSHTRYCRHHRIIRRGAGRCAPTPSENRGWPTQTPTTIIGRIHIGVQIRRHQTHQPDAWHARISCLATELLGTHHPRHGRNERHPPIHHRQPHTVAPQPIPSGWASDVNQQVPIKNARPLERNRAFESIDTELQDYPHPVVDPQLWHT